MEPHQTCRFITKLVPHLRAREECVEVPQEVCGTSRAPIKKQRPSIMNWCYMIGNKPSYLAPAIPSPAVTATSSKVLLNEIKFRDFALASAADVNTIGDEISVELFGEKIVKSSDAVSCSFSFADLQSYNSSIIYDKEMTLGDEEELGGCYRVNIYRQY